MADIRVRLGQERVGLPMMQTYEALGYTVDSKGWKKFRKQPLYYYFDRMLGQWLISTIDATLNDEQLSALDPDETRIISLLLMRDMLRHNSLIVWKGRGNNAWVSPLFREIAPHLDLHLERFADDDKPYDLERETDDGWSARLAAPIGIPAEKLFATHRAIVMEVAQKFKIRKPWWQFW